MPRRSRTAADLGITPDALRAARVLAVDWSSLETRRTPAGAATGTPGPLPAIPGFPPIPGRHFLCVDGWMPASVNEFTTVRRKIGLKKRDRAAVAVADIGSGIPRATARRRVSLHVTLGPRRKEPDPDNLQKSLLDSLKHASLIVDDRARWVETGPTGFDRGPATRTVVILDDVPSTGE